MAFKKLLLVTSLVALMPISTLAADSASDSVTINGSVANTCTLGIPVQAGVSGGASLDSGATSTAATLTFPNIASSSTAIYTGFGGSVMLTMAGMCNYAATLGIQTTNGALTNSTTANVPVAGSAAFADDVNYQASASWNGTGPNLSTNGTAGLKANHVKSGAINSDIDLTISLQNPSLGAGSLMLAGDYTDSVTMKIGVAL